MNIDTKDPVWNGDEFRTQRQPRTIVFLSYSQPVLKHFGSRRATTDDELPRSRKIFRANVNAVLPVTRFKTEIVRQARLADDAGCIDNVTTTQLMLLTIACSITNREPAHLFSDAKNNAIEVGLEKMLLL